MYNGHISLLSLILIHYNPLNTLNPAETAENIPSFYIADFQRLCVEGPYPVKREVPPGRDLQGTDVLDWGGLWLIVLSPLIAAHVCQLQWKQRQKNPNKIGNTGRPTSWCHFWDQKSIIDKRPLRRNIYTNHTLTFRPYSYCVQKLKRMYWDHSENFIDLKPSMYLCHL